MRIKDAEHKADLIETLIQTLGLVSDEIVTDDYLGFVDHDKNSTHH